MIGRRGALVVFVILLLFVISGCAKQQAVEEKTTSGDTSGEEQAVELPELTESTESLDEEKYSGEQANFLARILNKIREKLSSD